MNFEFPRDGIAEFTHETGGGNWARISLNKLGHAGIVSRGDLHYYSTTDSTYWCYCTTHWL